MDRPRSGACRRPLQDTAPRPCLLRTQGTRDPAPCPAPPSVAVGLRPGAIAAVTSEGWVGGAPLGLPVPTAPGVSLPPRGTSPQDQNHGAVRPPQTGPRCGHLRSHHGSATPPLAACSQQPHLPLWFFSPQGTPTPGCWTQCHTGLSALGGSGPVPGSATARGPTSRATAQRRPRAPPSSPEWQLRGSGCSLGAGPGGPWAWAAPARGLPKGPAAPRLSCCDLGLWGRRTSPQGLPASAWMKRLW